MKFTLSESLFDDNFEIATSGDFNSDIDDDFKLSDYDTDPVAIATTNDSSPYIPETPSAGVNTGIADMLIAAINDEWEAIKTYNSIVATLTYESAKNSKLSTMIPVIQDIANEENKHVGQLQEILGMISPNTQSIKAGEIEGREQVLDNGHRWVGGKLQVEMHTPMVTNDSTINNDQPNTISDMCSIDDVDDEW